MSTMLPSNQGITSDTLARRAKVPSTPSTTRATRSQTHIQVNSRWIVASMARLAHTSPDMVKMCTAQAAARIRAGYCADDTNISSQWMKLIWEVYAVHSLSTYLRREQPHGSSQILQARLPSPELSLPHTARYSNCAANAASIRGSTHSYGTLVVYFDTFSSPILNMCE